MKRRGFIASIIGALAAPFVKVPAAAAAAPVEEVRWRDLRGGFVLDAPSVSTLHGIDRSSNSWWKNRVHAKSDSTFSDADVAELKRAFAEMLRDRLPS